jgi:adenylate kinase
MVLNRRNCKDCKKVFSILNKLNKCCKECNIENSNNWEQRWDDNTDLFGKRYKIYKTETFPIIERIRNESNYLKLDLIKDPNAMQKILALIKPAN